MLIAVSIVTLILLVVWFVGMKKMSLHLKPKNKSS